MVRTKRGREAEPKRVEELAANSRRLLRRGQVAKVEGQGPKVKSQTMRLLGAVFGSERQYLNSQTTQFVNGTTSSSNSFFFPATTSFVSVDF